MNHDFHNPDNLTPEQVGPGFRLLLKSEIKSSRQPNIEINAWLSDRWSNHNDSVYRGESPVITYRVPLATWPLPKEPWALGRSVNGFTLAEGQEWHRQDWTEDMLPPGTRPLLAYPSKDAGEYEASQVGKTWYKYVGEGCEKWSIGQGGAYWRTTRPLPIIEPEWITWSGGEYPFKDDEVGLAEIKFRSGHAAPSDKPYFLDWRHDQIENDIIAYRVLKWKTKPGSTRASSEPTLTDNDAWESLLVSNANLGKRVSELENDVAALRITCGSLDASREAAVKQKEACADQLEDANRLKQAALDGVKMWSDRANQAADDLKHRDATIEKLQSRLAQLEWRPISVKPTEQDADSAGDIQLLLSNGATVHGAWHTSCISDCTHWRPCAPPDAIDTDRVEFEELWTYGEGYRLHKEEAFHLFELAREVKP